MGVEENEDESVNLLEVQHEVAAEEEPIEQVFSQEAEDIRYGRTIHRIRRSRKVWRNCKI